MTTKTPIREAAEAVSDYVTDALDVATGFEDEIEAIIQRALSGRCWLRLFCYVGKCRQIPTFRNATATTNAARR